MDFAIGDEKLLTCISMVSILNLFILGVVCADYIFKEHLLSVLMCVCHVNNWRERERKEKERSIVLH